MNDDQFTEEDIAEAEQRWRSARTLDELCEFTARFIEGRFPFFPGYGGPTVAPETEPIVEPLAALNRRGVLTIGSQPGAEGKGRDGKIWQQRAFVCGFAEPDVAHDFTKVTLRSDVVAYSAGPEVGTGWFSIPAAKDEDGPSLWIGRPSRPESMYLLESLEHVFLRADVAVLHYVEAFDPRWGRSGYLWEQIDQV